MDEKIKKLLEEYKHGDREKRIDLRLMVPELREKFTEIERHLKNPPQKFGVEPCQTCCGR